ncbi:MAG: MotA/TolQ/ExbB proton channel family protein [Polyangiaceae bacterium]
MGTQDSGDRTMNIVEKSKNLMLAVGASPLMYLLIGLSVVSAAIVLERLWYLIRVDEDPQSLSKALATLLNAGDIEGARARMKSSKSPAAAVALAGLDEAHNGVDSVEEAMQGALVIQRAALERGLAFLGTIGNNAPFVGLLGTVVGIVLAFDRLGDAGKVAAGPTMGPATEVMSSIAEALVATAIGLLVALPAVAAYNYFQRRIKSVLSGTQVLGHVLLSWLKAKPTDLPPPARLASNDRSGARPVISVSIIDAAGQEI